MGYSVWIRFNWKWAKLSDGAPTPGGVTEHQEWVGVANVVQGNCYPPQDHIHRGEYVLEGRVVTMESQNSVIDDGRILVIDGMIEAVWSASDQTPSAAEGVVSIPTSGTIYPVSLIHTIMRNTTLFHYGITELMAGITATNGRLRIHTEMRKGSWFPNRSYCTKICGIKGNSRREYCTTRKFDVLY